MSLIKELLEKVEKPNKNINPLFLKDKKNIILILALIIIFFLIFLFIKTHKSSQTNDLIKKNIEFENKKQISAPLLLEDVINDIPKEEIPSLLLKGIIYDPKGDSCVFINDRLLKEKDSLEGVEIFKIEKEKVKIVFNNKIYELTLTSDQ